MSETAEATAPTLNQEYKKAVASGDFTGSFKEFMQKLFGDKKTQTILNHPMSTTTKVLIALAVITAGYLLFKKQ